MVVSAEVRNGLTEDEIWKRFKRGDIDAFNLMFAKYFNHMRWYGRKLTDDGQLIEDCIQESFIEIWYKRERLSETNSIKYYMFKSLKRKMLRRLKKESRVLTFSEAEKSSERLRQTSHEGTIIDIESNMLIKKRLARAIRDLSSKQQKAIFLRFYTQLSIQEISDILGIGTKSAYRVVSGALKKLRVGLM